ncbi:kunitz-type serine protease inhibitor vestiginin-1-like [Amblyomma americanum]
MIAGYVIRLLAIAHLVSSLRAASAQTRNKQCLEPPDMENCTIVLWKWSFKSGPNECGTNFVCSKHPNSFLSKEECIKTCPPIPGKKPKPRKKDCTYWILHGDD